MSWGGLAVSVEGLSFVFEIFLVWLRRGAFRVFEWLWEARKGFPRLFGRVKGFSAFSFFLGSWSVRLSQIEGTRGVFWPAYPKPSPLLKWALVSF